MEENCSMKNCGKWFGDWVCKECQNFTKEQGVQENERKRKLTSWCTEQMDDVWKIGRES